MINYGPSAVLFFIETSQTIAGHDTYIGFPHEGIFRIPSIHLADTEGFFFFLPTISRDIAEMVNCPITNWKDPPCLMGKSTINGHFQ